MIHLFFRSYFLSHYFSSRKLLAHNCDPDNNVDFAEFAIFYLVRTGKIDKNYLQSIHELFDEIDRDTSGIFMNISAQPYTHTPSRADIYIYIYVVSAGHTHNNNYTLA